MGRREGEGGFHSFNPLHKSSCIAKVVCFFLSSDSQHAATCGCGSFVSSDSIVKSKAALYGLSGVCGTTR